MLIVGLGGIGGLLGKAYGWADRSLFGGGLPGGAPRGGTSWMTGRVYKPGRTFQPPSPTSFRPPSGTPRFPGPGDRAGVPPGGRFTGPTVITSATGDTAVVVPSSRDAILWIRDYPQQPKGYRKNKSAYYRDDPQTGQPVRIPRGTVWVRNRYRNPLNAKAARKAANRLDAAATRMKEVFGSSFTIKRKPPRTTRRKRK